MSLFYLTEVAVAPGTPDANKFVFYVKSDGLLYFKNDAGVETPFKPVGAGTGDLLSDGSVPLIANWDVGAFTITALRFISDVATGTAPLTVTSTTQVDNLTSEWASKALAVVEPCRNESGAPLTKGTPVYISGYSVGQDLILVSAADSDAAGTMPCIGLIAADIANNADGYVVIEGDVNGVDTSGYTIGDELYVSGTAGTLTATRPTGTALVQEAAIVLRVHATLGVLQVIPGAEVEGLPNLAQDNAWVGNASGIPTATDAAGLRTLLNVENGATADQSDAEIETAYNNQVAAASQVEMEAGTETAIRRMTPQRVAQAIAALAPSGAVEFADSDWRVTGSVDATKKVAFEVDGIATGTTRTITMPDSDVDLGGVATLVQNKFDATVAPAVSNDNTEGYAVGSRWIDITNDKEYVCLDASTGAAVWTETTVGAGGVSSGTFTPTIQDSSLSDGEGQTYSAQVGVYRKIGDVCHFWIDMTITSLGTLTTTQAARIGGLPFASASTGLNYSAMVTIGTNLNLTSATSLNGNVVQGQAYMTLNKWDATTGPSSVVIDDISSDGRIAMSGSYVTV